MIEELTTSHVSKIQEMVHVAEVVTITGTPGITIGTIGEGADPTIIIGEVVDLVVDSRGAVVIEIIETAGMTEADHAIAAGRTVVAEIGSLHLRKRP